MSAQTHPRRPSDTTESRTNYCTHGYSIMLLTSRYSRRECVSKPRNSPKLTLSLVPSLLSAQSKPRCSIRCFCSTVKEAPWRMVLMVFVSPASLLLWSFSTSSMSKARSCSSDSILRFENNLRRPSLSSSITHSRL